MANYTPGATRHIPPNLLETAHKDTGKWLNRDDLEAWVFRRFAQLEAERDRADALDRELVRVDKERSQQRLACLKVEKERDALAARVEKAERIADREATGFRAMCEAFENLETIVGLDTGGGMGPGPALNAVESIMRERDALAAHVERLKKAALDAIPNLPGGEVKANLRHAYDDAPETSLNKLIAEKQAEAFDELAGDLALNADNARENGYTEAADVMQDAADYALTKAEMRRQAGGDA